MEEKEPPMLVLPEDFDDYAWEVEAKGVFWEVRLRYDGLEYPLTFYEPVRLAQDISDQLKASPVFFEQNLMVVPKVTREAMELAVRELVGGQGVNQLRSA